MEANGSQRYNLARPLDLLLEPPPLLSMPSSVPHLLERGVVVDNMAEHQGGQREAHDEGTLRVKGGGGGGGGVQEEMVVGVVVVLVVVASSMWWGRTSLVT